MSREFIFKIDGALYDEETKQAIMKPELQGELVRCKDCKYYKEYKDVDDKRCLFNCTFVTISDYCSHAERKDNKANCTNYGADIIYRIPLDENGEEEWKKEKC